MAVSGFLSGTHHCTIFDGKEHGPTHRQFNECTIHPGHEKFMTVDEFLNKKPSEIGLDDDEDMSKVRNVIARTVRVVVSYTSVDRPDTFINSENPYPCKDIKGNYNKTRYGTGYLYGRCNVGDDANANDNDIDNNNNDDGSDDNDAILFCKEPCPCPECKTSTRQTPNRKSYYVIVQTATHVIFDEHEAQRAMFEFFYDSDDRGNVEKLCGVTVLDTRHLRLQTDRCRVVCITHNDDLAQKLGDLCEGYDHLPMGNMLVSHPHGVSKMISVADHSPEGSIVLIPNKKSVQLKKGTEIRFPACHDYTRVVEDINRLLDKRVISRKWPSNSLVLDCDLKVFRPEGVVVETDICDYLNYQDGKGIQMNKLWCNVFYPGTQLVTEGGKCYTFPYNKDKVPGVKMEVFGETKYFFDKNDKGNLSVFMYYRHYMAACPGSSGAQFKTHLPSILKSETGHTHFGNSGDYNTGSLVCVNAHEEVDFNSIHSNNFFNSFQYNSMIPAPVGNQATYQKAKSHPHQIHGIPWRFMNNERYRLMSFVKFPINSPVSTISLASKGFAYFTNESERMIICYFCITQLKTFNDMAKIDEEHKRLGLDCPMVKGTHSNNISMEQQCPDMNADDIFSKLLASRQNESQVEQPHPSAATPLSQDDNSNEVTSSQPSDESAPYVVVTNFSDIAESDSHLQNPGLSREHSQILEDSASSQDQEAATSQFTSVPQSNITDNIETEQSSSAMENSSEQQNSSQQEQPIDSTNAADENAGDATSYEKLGIITARPKRIEYALYVTRLDSFKEWPKDHHMKPEDLAKAGYFYTGYSDCARCFYCGGGLRNWENEDNVWVEHARWFPKCVFLLQEVGKDFIDTVQVISTERDQITFDDVIKRMPSGAPAPFELKEKSFERDPAILTVIDNGFDKDQIIKLAQEISKSGELISSDTLYEAAKARNFRKKEGSNFLGSDSVSIRKGGNEKRDKETVEALRNENSESRRQTMCKMCTDKEVAIVFLPCGHLVSCTECSSALTTCPICRFAIKGIVRAYVP